MIEDRFFHITPQIVRADREQTICLHPLYEHCQLRADHEYVATYYPVEEFSQRSGWPDRAIHRLRPRDGALYIRQYFEGEQEHVLLIEEESADGRLPIADLRIYSLGKDLFERRPFKGDLHMHSNRSDGRESPDYVAAASRRIGLDFMAVTDHGRYAPSIEAQQAFADVDIDLAIYRGEEVHPPDNPVHMINFGGRHSVNDLFSTPRYRAEVAKQMDGLGTLPPGVDRYQFASCCWCFDEMRRAGGLGIFCHPYWFTQHRYSPSGALTSLMFERQPFDAFELIGGYWPDHVDSNRLQVARYNQERAAGRAIPIVGVSDAHGCERGGLFGWYYTLVFSPSTQLADLRESIKELYSVAVEAMPGEAVRPYGPFRMVKYALFLLHHVLPRHDELCLEEGRWMLQHLAGDAGAKLGLSRLQGRTQQFYDRIWAP